MKGFLCLLFYLFLTSLCYSQTDDPEIDFFIEKANYYNYKSQDSALFFSKKAYDIAVTKKDTFLIAAAGYYYSFYLITSNKFEKAATVLNFNVQNSNFLSEVLLGNTFYNLGSISYLKEAFDTSIEHYLTAQEYYKSSKNKKGLARTQLQLSVIYQKLGNTKMENYFGSLSLSNSEKKENSTTAISLVEKIKIIEDQLTSTTLSDKMRSILSFNLGTMYFDSGNMKKAIASFTTSLDFKEKIGFSNLKAETKVYIAEAYLSLQDYKNTLKTINTLPLIEKRKQPLKIEYILTEAYKGMGDYKRALYHNQKLATLQDSINSIGENIKVAQITAQYDTEEKEVQILSLQKENKNAFLEIDTQRKKWIIALVLALILLTTTIWFVKRWKASEKRIALVEEQKDKMEQKVEAQHLLLKSKSKVYLDELQFVKSDGNYVEFHSVAKKMLEREKLKEILEKLPPNFVRVHRSYIVNKNQIESFNSSTVFLKFGHQIPLSRTYKENL